MEAVRRFCQLRPESISRVVVAGKRAKGECPNGRGKTSRTDEDSRAIRALYWNSRSASSRTCLCESEHALRRVRKEILHAMKRCLSFLPYKRHAHGGDHDPLP